MNVDLPEETVEKLTQIKHRQDLESLEEAIDYVVAEANESSEVGEDSSMEKVPADVTPRESARVILKRNDGQIPDHATGGTRELLEEVQEEMSKEGE